jgi:hypothetical protein
MIIRIAIVLGVAVACATPALADIPVNDAAQLTQKSQTASTTVTLVPVTTQRQSAHNGVHCAVTTGKKAAITNSTVQPQSGAGTQAIQTYAPDQPTTPDSTAQGAALNSQTLFQSSGGVVGALSASGSTLTAAQSAFQSAGREVGAAQTVMASIDMNSAARLQNNLAWNSAIDSANLWVIAINALNLALTSDMSSTALAMRASMNAAAQPASGPACPAGLIGSGTASDPCRAPTTCSTTPPGAPPDPACVSARILDSEGDVLFYLDQVQSAANAASTGGGAAAATTTAASH